MRILLINQAFYPDVVATAQYLTALAEALALRDHEVRVLAARRAYDDPSRRFARRERYAGIEIERVSGTGLGKVAKWRRAVDFATFLLRAGLRVLTMPRMDRVVALTSPPLVAALAALRCRLRGERFVYWVMDMNPDEALAAGWLRPGIVARLLERISRFTVQSADAVVVLDRFMRERVVAKGVAPERIHVIPPWSMDRYAFFDAPGRAAFRQRHGLAGRFVVMYSGNHSPVHPLDTLIEAAEQLKQDARFAFVFVGGGSEFGRLQAKASAAGLGQVKFLPYQPIDSLSASLSAADVQAVVLGSPMVGTIHPSKVYNILAVGSRILYVGPEASHISDVMETRSVVQSNGDARRYMRVDFHRAEEIAAWLKECSAVWDENESQTAQTGCEEFSEARLLPRIVQVIEEGR